jgi:hypothetical protein
LPALTFAVVGDSRPSGLDDTEHYPMAVITGLFKDLQALSPRPFFVVGTGDYMNADSTRPKDKSQAFKQIDLYYQATTGFSGPVYPALGNHECGTRTSSNCGPAGHEGLTPNYQAFLGLLGKLGLPNDKAYYTRELTSSDPAHPWTAKLVLIAANAWDDAQAAWLEKALTEATTYTLVVRHEPDDANAQCFGCGASDAIVKRHPYTLLLTGHEHTFRIERASKELVVGVGGAPLYDPRDHYGYVVCTQRPDGNLACRERDAGADSSSYADSSMVVTPNGDVVK